MKRLFASTLLFLFALVSALADIWPFDDDIGQITEGSSAVLAAFAEEYSEKWIETYVSEDYRQEFRLLHEDRISSILPLDSFIVSEDSDEIRIKDSTGAALITVFTDESSLIEAISFQVRP